MTVQNRERLLRKLAAIRGAPRKAIHQALEVGAQDIVALQKRLAPKKTGALARSIGYTFGGHEAENANVRGVASSGAGDPDLTVVIHAGDAKAFYAAFVEFGTAPHVNGGRFAGSQHPGAKARPFFFPAYRAKKKSVKSRISRATTKAVKGAAR